jgi:hypothetical protein
MVVLSVLFALTVDSCYERHREQVEADEAVEAIRAEVRLNLEELQDAMAKIERRAGLLDSVGRSLGPDDTFYPHQYEFDGFYTPDLQDAAWQFALRQPYLSLLPREFVEDAFRVYDWHFDILVSEIESFATSPLVHTPGKARIAFSIARYITQEDTRWVRSAIEKHRAFLEKHGGGT